MTPPQRIEPGLLRRMTVRRVVDVLRSVGPSSRADLVRHTGISAPTISKAVASLLSHGLLEEAGTAAPGALGRPGTRLALASQGAGVIGVALDAGSIDIIQAGLDGTFIQTTRGAVDTPRTYRGLINSLVRRLAPMTSGSANILGIGISTPGLIDRERQHVLLSPNLPITNDRSPARDLEDRLGIPCRMIQESHALCLAERMYGRAQDVRHFAMVDATTGLGLGVMQDDQLILGDRGLAGELGHFTVEPEGLPCGCGNRGCLETRATDVALARALGRDDGVDATQWAALTDAAGARPAIELTATWLSVALSGVINLFNPAAVFVHSRWLDSRPDLFDDLTARTRRRSLGPSSKSCRIEPAHGSKLQGAVAGALRATLDATHTA